jgi:hypothetical protein
MESYAVFTACEQAAEPRPKYISIKPVCDFEEEEKTAPVHHYAANVSAKFGITILDSPTSFSSSWRSPLKRPLKYGKH